jgi:hypothetical protein
MPASAPQSHQIERVLRRPQVTGTAGLFDLLVAAPQARVVTTFIGAGTMSTERPCRWTALERMLAGFESPGGAA